MASWFSLTPFIPTFSKNLFNKRNWCIINTSHWHQTDHWPYDLSEFNESTFSISNVLGLYLPFFVPSVCLVWFFLPYFSYAYMSKIRVAGRVQVTPPSIGTRDQYNHQLFWYILWALIKSNVYVSYRGRPYLAVLLATIFANEQRLPSSNLSCVEFGWLRIRYIDMPIKMICSYPDLIILSAAHPGPYFGDPKKVEEGNFFPDPIGDRCTYKKGVS